MPQASENTVREERFEGTDGFAIFMRSWQPSGKPRAVVVIVPGFNAHSGQYQWVGDQLASSGLSVYAVDLRGRGKSDGERFFVTDIEDYLSDVDQVVKTAKSRQPGLPVFLLGHSAGGVVSCVYTLEHQAELTGLICEDFAFQVPAPDLALAVIKGISHLAPHAHALKLKNEDFSRDPVAVKHLNEDPLIANEAQPTQTVAVMVRADERLKKEFPKITLPVFILHGTADKVTKFQGSQLFYERAGAADKTLKLYEGHFHDLLNDFGKEEVLEDVKKWIDKRIPASQKVA